MITTRYFVVRPKPALHQAIERAGVANNDARPELLVKQCNGRRRTREADDVAQLKAHYLQIFLHEHFAESPERVAVARQFESQDFDALWTVEVFNYSENLDDLIDATTQQDNGPE